MFVNICKYHHLIILLLHHHRPKLESSSHVSYVTYAQLCTTTQYHAIRYNTCIPDLSDSGKKSLRGLQRVLGSFELSSNCPLTCELFAEYGSAVHNVAGLLTHLQIGW